ncbi:protein phosphatase 1 regulatory subunit 12C-like isoform X3 [Biomphalaria glabrata]|uniref:Protein phosphatase 1 regulatory subunit 12B n=1 Tax=Biomphalaria glabrata TaxID=6526 RepID=A0A9W3AN75_BIOGL|nr:protein phosphatase 1 regulatory subunit 12C-like isoform X3 [Biomphalaria glabrata]
MSVVGVDEKQVSALIRRHEQVKRWEDSDTNLEPVSPKKDSVKVKFQDGCVFLAACSSGDKEEVKKLLQRGADINTANVDGLTALHQACIDDNIEMVEFLVEQGADVDVCDNEGWTPLHATASCAFTEIARYLIKHGANVAAVNNDGDLPSDIAENDEMEKLLKDEMKKQGIDENSAKCEEEQRMLEDANKWLKDKNVEEIKHPKTGASALHVAAAKGYLKVMSLLLEAGVDVNAEDFDGWTPLHAAAHWGQEEACKLLVENMCDMEHKNKAGHTAFDLADKDMLTLLEELKEKQTSYKNRHETDKEIILPPGHVIKRSSVTRMSGDQKQNVIQRTSEEERVALLSIHPSKNEDKTANSISLDESEETETERKNEKNKQVSQQIQPPTCITNTTTTSSWQRTAILTSLPPSAEIRRPDMPKIEEVSETERPTVVSTSVSVTVTTAPSINTVPSVTASISSITTSSDTATTAVLSSKPTVSISKVESLADPTSDASIQLRQRRSRLMGHRSLFFSSPIESPEIPISSVSNTGRDLVSRSISVPARLPTEKDDMPTPVSTATDNVPSWRQGLRKTGSTSMVHERMSENESNSLPRSASSPRLAQDARLELLQERLANRRPYSSTGGSVTTVTTSTMSTVTDKIGDRNSYTFGQNYTGLRTNRLSNYVPSYQARQQREANANSEDKQGLSELGRLRDRNSLTGLSSTSSSPSPIPASSATTSPSTNINSLNRRSFEPPKRDEETETQRKARAKHARQTRRSTQGVSLEDIEKAEEVLRSNDPLNPTSTYTSTSRTSVSTKDNGVVSNGQSVTTGIATTTTTTNSSCDNPTKEDSSVISGYRLRTSEDKSDAVDSPVTRSFRRAREDKDLTSSSNTSTDITSNYIPRSQRNSAILSSEPSSSITSSQSLLRTSSLRTNRVRNCETDSIQTPKAEEESRNDDSSLEKKDEKKESSSIRSRRQRRERRSTGIVYDNEEGELSKENKPEEDKSDNLGSSKYSSRFSSNSDAPSSDRTQRPTSYSEYSRSTGSLDIDYKKKYEDEKSENERLRKELEETKKSLLDAKAELDKVLKQREKEQPRNSERDKRTLERKISEMEEELKKMDALKADNQRLKDENGALIRVISKLSK